MTASSHCWRSCRRAPTRRRRRRKALPPRLSHRRRRPRHNLQQISLHHAKRAHPPPTSITQDAPFTGARGRSRTGGQLRGGGQGREGARLGPPPLKARTFTTLQSAQITPHSKTYHELQLTIIIAFKAYTRYIIDFLRHNLATQQTRERPSLQTKSPQQCVQQH
jgi:hypothetical protein